MSSHPFRLKQPIFVKVLFGTFDPYLTFEGDEILFRDRSGKQLVAVKDATELLVLAFSAMREIGGKKLPTRRAWDELCGEGIKLIAQETVRFDWDRYTRESQDRISPLDPDEYGYGSYEIMYLHANLIFHSKEIGPRKSKSLWCLLCLLWIDTALRRLNDPMDAIESVLRAAVCLQNASPKLSASAARIELSKFAASVRYKNDEVQAEKQEVKKTWERLRLDPEFAKPRMKTRLAERLSELHRRFQDIDTILGWMRDWEKELAAKIN